MPQNAPPPFVTIDDYVAMGKLIDQWSHTPSSRPKNPKELWNQCNAAGVGMSTNVKDYKEIEFVEDTPNVFKIRLPSPEALKQAMNMMNAPGFAYPVPNYYKKAWGNVLPTGLATKTNREDFHNGRIGDYTISSCM